MDNIIWFVLLIVRICRNENCDAVPVERVGGIEDPRLKPNKLLWTDHKSESIALIRPSLKTQKRTELDWIHLFKCPSDIPKLQSRTPVDYFMLMFPRGILRPLLEKTTDAMTQQHTDISLTTTLLWKYIGLRLMFANDKIANIESSWHKPNSATDYHIPMNITQRFGVSLDTFRLIDECLTWGTKDKDEVRNCCNLLFIYIAVMNDYVSVSTTIGRNFEV